MRGFADTIRRSRLRALGPASSAVPLSEALRSGLGAVVGLGAAAALAILVSPGQGLGFYLIAPFGATAVLIFSAPNSPLAQPWPAIVGNTLSALVALLVCRFVESPMVAVPLSVGLAVIVMALCRATHPPGGAVAMTVAIGSVTIAPLGLGFAFLPVATGTTLLVAIAALYAYANGRRYPLRQFGEQSPKGTADSAPATRLGLTEKDLSDILVRYRQSLNLGIEDLARLIAAAQMQAASQRLRPQIASDIMSCDLVTVEPDVPLQEIAGLFARHGFTSLPVVDTADRYLGVIFQLHLIARLHSDPRPDGRLTRLGDGLCAADLMDAHLPAAAPETPIASLLPQLAGNSTDAVPVLRDGRIVGIVTRTDLIAALSRQILRATVK